MSAPVSPPAAPAPLPPLKPKGFGVTALVLGIVSLALCWIPVVSIFTGIITGIVGAVFGLIGLSKSHRGMSIAGLVTAALGCVLAVVVNAAVAGAMANYPVDRVGAAPLAPTTDQPQPQLAPSDLASAVDPAPAPVQAPVVAPAPTTTEVPTEVPVPETVQEPAATTDTSDSSQAPAQPPQDQSLTYSVHATGAMINTVSYMTRGFNIAQDSPSSKSWTKKVSYGDDGDMGWNMNAQLDGTGTITCTVTDNATGQKMTNTSHGQYVVVSCSAP